MVLHINTQKQIAECPVPFAEAATPEAKNLKVFTWNPAMSRFDQSTVTEWLDGSQHLMTTLLLTG